MLESLGIETWHIGLVLLIGMVFWFIGISLSGKNDDDRIL